MNNSSTPRETLNPHIIAECNDAARRWLMACPETPFSTPASASAIHKHLLHALPAGIQHRNHFEQLDALEQAPWILCALAQNGLETDPQSALRYSERAYRLFDRLDDRAGLCFAWSGIIFGHVMAGDDLRLLDPWLDALDDIYAYRPESRDPVCNVRVMQALAVALLHRGKTSTRHAVWLERTAAVLNASFELEHRMALGPFLGLYAICTGDLNEAAGIFHSLKADAATDTPAPATRALGYVFSALFGWITGDTQASKRAVEAGLAVVAGTNAFRIENWLLLQGGYAHLLDGDTVTARAYLRRSEAMQAQTNHLRSVWYGLLHAFIHLCEQDATRAEVYVRLSLINATRQHSQFNRNIVSAFLSCVLIKKGDSAQTRYGVDSAQSIRAM